MGRYRQGLHIGNFRRILSAYDHIELETHFPENAMDKLTFQIPKISCGHCTRTIENELKELDGVSSVESSVADKTVTVEYQNPATREKLLATLKEINYPAI
jgi:copper chaperone CopZ